MTKNDSIRSFIYTMYESALGLFILYFIIRFKNNSQIYISLNKIKNLFAPNIPRKSHLNLYELFSNFSH